MKNAISVLLIVLLGGCGALRDSAINPANWGAEEETATADVVDPALRDARPLVAQIRSARLDTVSGGQVLTVEGVTPRQGYWRPGLVVLNNGVPQDGTLVYQFRAFPPRETTSVGPPRSREIVAGRKITNRSLAGVRRIIVQGAQNQIALRP